MTLNRLQIKQESALVYFASNEKSPINRLLKCVSIQRVRLGTLILSLVLTAKLEDIKNPGSISLAYCRLMQQMCKLGTVDGSTARFCSQNPISEFDVAIGRVCEHIGLGWNLWWKRCKTLTSYQASILSQNSIVKNMARSRSLWGLWRSCVVWLGFCSHPRFLAPGVFPDTKLLAER